MIDILSGLTFLRGENAIDLAGFKVVREALSATYGILFSVFVATVFLESRLLKDRSSFLDGSIYSGGSMLDLWFLSPFSDFLLLRKIFWLLFIDGFIFLAGFSIIHLTLTFPPDSARMGTPVYMLIGAVDAIFFIVCAPFAYRTYQNLQHVRSMLSAR